MITCGYRIYDLSAFRMNKNKNKGDFAIVRRGSIC